jgi:hypothetical protein
MTKKTTTTHVHLRSAGNASGNTLEFSFRPRPDYFPSHEGWEDYRLCKLQMHWRRYHTSATCVEKNECTAAPPQSAAAGPAAAGPAAAPAVIPVAVISLLQLGQVLFLVSLQQGA